ncbi:hypothetical protein E2R51_13165 [Jeotgalibacillus sp. S-D1]|uniref:hypothetical protein n=1 Tax=Jeotgalibacillus sp. S-D1 TaxID=2552189 RepID=UPI001059EA7C|nr:hypothetical protein [Jeotgalibacillus sp. S-D1]TDL31318.1 hypothetical protein E2R51_13165 [Jeotgalibacillus sp. S-D1]
MGEILLVIGTVGFVIALIWSMEARIRQMDTRLIAMQQRLEQLAEAAGIPEPEENEELRALIQNGKKVAAVKRARELFGLSLLEAKQYIDALEMNSKPSEKV